jgi:hypothetical protein
MSSGETRRTRNTVPDWKLERFLLEELDDLEMQEIRAWIETDEVLQKRLRAMEQSNQEILREYPPGWMASRIREKLGPAPKPRRTLRRAGATWRVLVPAAAGVLLAVLVLPHLFRRTDVPPGVDTRLKGASQLLRIYRKTDTGTTLLQDGARATAGDLIRIQYQTGDRPFVAILSVDARGTITRHLTAPDGGAVEVDPMLPHFLDHSFELDDTPGWEVFYLVAASTPFSVDRITHAIGEALPSSPTGQPDRQRTRPGPSGRGLRAMPGPLDLPDDFRTTRFTLIKNVHHED